jgi:tRNA-dihydrouridine synthase B
LTGADPIAAPTGNELTDVVLEHYAGILDEYGPTVGVRAARKHIDWYLEAARIVLAPEVRRPLLENPDPRGVAGLLRSIFSSELREAA